MPQHKFKSLLFKLKKKFCIHNNFQKIGYYSDFYSSLNDEKKEKWLFKKNKKRQWILSIWQKHEFTCYSEYNLQTITISSFWWLFKLNLKEVTNILAWKMHWYGSFRQWWGLSMGRWGSTNIHFLPLICQWMSIRADW